MLNKKFIKWPAVFWLLLIVTQVHGQRPKIVLPIGHSDAVSTCIFSPDNKLIVTGARDGTSKIWEIATGRLLYTLQGTLDYFTSDGKYIITTVDWNDTRIWDAKTGILLHTMDGAESELSPDQTTLITVSKKTLNIKKVGPISVPVFCKIWDVKSGQLRHSFQISDLTDGTVYFYFSPDSTHLVTLVDHEGMEAEFKLWNLKTGKKIFEENGLYFDQFSPDGKYLIINTDYLYSKQEPSRTKVLELKNDSIEVILDGPEDVVFSPDGKYHAITTQEKTVLRDTKSNDTLFASSVASHNLLFSPDSKKLIIVLKSGAEVWQIGDSITTTTLNSMVFDEKGFDLKFHITADSRHVIISNDHRKPEIWGLNPVKKIGTFNFDTYAYSTLDPVLISPNSEIVFIEADNNNNSSKANLWKIDDATPLVEINGRPIAFSHDSKWVAIIPPAKPTDSKEYSEDFVLIKAVKSGEEIPLKGIGYSIRQAKFGWDGNFFTTQFAPGDYSIKAKTSLWDVLSGEMVYQTSRSILFHPSGEVFATDRSDGILEVRKCATRDTVVTIQNDHEYWGFNSGGQIWMANALKTFGNRDKTIASANSDSEIEIRNETGKIKQVIRPSLQTLGAPSIVLSNDGHYLVSYSALDNKCYITDLSSGKSRLYENDDRWIQTLSISGNNKLLAINYFRQTHVIELGKYNLNKILQGVTQSIFSPDGKTITVNGREDITTYDVSTWQVLKKYGYGGYDLLDINFQTEKGLFSRGNELVLMDMKSGHPIINLILIDSANWVVTHPSGLFDATPGAMDKLYFVAGLETIELNQLKARYYEPGLWKKAMRGETLRNVIGFNKVELPPEIKMGAVDKRGMLAVEVVDRGGGIGEISFYVNGKEVIADLRQSEGKQISGTLTFSIPVSTLKNLLPGTENYLAVRAWNSGKWIESKGAIVKYQTPSKAQIKPAIHIVVCGVSDYTGSEIDLKYAAKDAGDMANALDLGAKRLFGTDKSFVYTLTSNQSTENQPTKVNILRTFETISSTASSEDVIVVYLSGHGINIGGTEGDFHYLTAEAFTGNPSAYNDPAIRNQATLSSNELVQLFKKVPALKQVLIIDACASGKVVDNLMVKKDIESSTLRALDRMKDRTGMHIITGCTADAVSYEASRYGQGILTYSLLEGFRGLALRDNKFADINQLFQYAQNRVPVLASGIGGIQKPQVFSPNGSQSFDIGELSSEDKKRIPIAAAKPIYIRSNFLDEVKLKDALGLGKKIDEVLNGMSAKGSDAALLFVDVSEYPDACQLSGLYKQIDGKLTLRMNLTCEGEETSHIVAGDNEDDLAQKILEIISVKK